MSAIDARPGVGRGFAFGALPSPGLYMSRTSFLPVTGPAPWGAPDSTMTGAQTLPACFVIRSSGLSRSGISCSGAARCCCNASVAWGRRCRTVIACREPCDGGVVVAGVYWDVL